MGYTVLSVAYPLTEVGENAVGGSEQILTLLDRALTEAGHRSLVIAAEGSSVRGTLIPSPRANGALDPKVREWGQKAHKRLIEDTLSRYSVDVVHMHSLDFHTYLPEPGVPTLATLHLPPDWYPPKIFRAKRAHFYLNCVSASQENACPESALLLPRIPNGVDVERFQYRTAKRNFAVSLGRICPEKGFHLAIDAAKQARIEFILAGEVFPYTAHEEYFKRKIATRLDRRRRFVGPVRFDTKRRLLSQAKCLLIPSSVQETSSLVAMEALAAGTPVIAFPSGALPEIVEHGRTGYLVTNTREMAKAIAAVDKLDPEECRREAQRRFSAEKMFQRYEETYRRIVSQKTASYDRPRAMSATSWLVSW
jgi:glycosyltransferase involved in cell wall biosynthesis